MLETGCIAASSCHRIFSFAATAGKAGQDCDRGRDGKAGAMEHLEVGRASSRC